MLQIDLSSLVGSFPLEVSPGVHERCFDRCLCRDASGQQKTLLVTPPVCCGPCCHAIPRAVQSKHVFDTCCAAVCCNSTRGGHVVSRDVEVPGRHGAW